jgi:hypothetical protein
LFIIFLTRKTAATATLLAALATLFAALATRDKANNEESKVNSNPLPCITTKMVSRKTAKQPHSVRGRTWR